MVNEVELKLIQVLIEVSAEVRQTERVFQTSRSILIRVSLRDAESRLLNRQKIFLQNNSGLHYSEKIRWDNGVPLFTHNMQATQPFQLKQVIQWVYNKLIMIRTSFLANFKLTVRYNHNLTVAYGAVGLNTKAPWLHHQIKQQQIQKLPDNFVANPKLSSIQGDFFRW